MDFMKKEYEAVNLDEVLTDEKTINRWKKQIKIAERLRGTFAKTEALQQLGIIYDKLGNFSEAINCYLQSLAIAKENKDDLNTIISLLNLGNIYCRQKRYKEAKSCFQHTLNIAKFFKSEDQDSYGKQDAIDGLKLIKNY